MDTRTLACSVLRELRELGCTLNFAGGELVWIHVALVLDMHAGHLTKVWEDL